MVEIYFPHLHSTNKIHSTLHRARPKEAQKIISPYIYYLYTLDWHKLLLSFMDDNSYW